MKVSIVTLHRVYNFGSILQAYATYTVFKKNKCQVEVIDYVTSQRTFKKMIKVPPAGTENMNVVKRKFFYILKFFSLLFRKITFEGFLKKNIKLSDTYVTIESLEKKPPKADLYVTGSDQTWNSKYNEGIDRGFFLDFLPEHCRRISFVSSFGKESLEDKEKTVVQNYIKRYEGLSVREDSAQKILWEMGRIDAIQLIDPTLQITSEEWVGLASKRLINKPYLLLFLLYNEDENATNYARKVADKNGWIVVKLSWELKRPKGVDKLMTHRSPKDFVSLIHYSEYVVTNSFHGLAFSINLKKQFSVIPRKEFNSRIESLLRVFGLSARMIRTEADLENINEIINYDLIEKILFEERERASKYIKRYIE